MVPTLYLFDRWEQRLGILPTLGALTHAEELNGEDTIELDCLAAPEKGDRLLWRDPDSGSWREHEVVRTDEPLDRPCHVYAESSLCELLRDYVVEEQIVSKSAAEAMASLLSGTRWQLGDVTLGDAKRSTLVYHTNALAALRRVSSVWRGELACEIEVVGGRVSARRISLLSRLGTWRGARLSYRANLSGCTRTVLEDEVFTALYGWGKGLPIEDEQGNPTGGYTRRLSFESVNNNVKWVGDEDARLAWGRWNQERSQRVHSFGQVIFPNCEDPNELLALTREALATTCQPRVSYECDVAVLAGAAVVGLGDDVAVLDSSRSPTWRLTARCVRRTRTFSGGATARHVTLGSVERKNWETTAEIATRVSAVEETASGASDAVASFEDLSEKEY
jgi:phage minor structural protein